MVRFTDFKEESREKGFASDKDINGIGKRLATRMKRKGVSPVIATLLLIVIAVTAAILAYVWVTGYMGRVTGTVEQQTAEQMQERIKINAVTTGTGSVTISVANIGEVDVTISGAYILNENRTAVCSSTPATKIASGAVGDVTITSCTLKSGAMYIAKVVTAKGTEATYVFTAP